MQGIEDVYSDVEKYCVSKNPGHMFKAIRNLNNKQVSHNCHIKDTNGVILNYAKVYVKDW